MRQRVVIYGGWSELGSFRNDTWEWDGAAWILRATGFPGFRQNGAFAFDSSAGTILLFGGDGLGGYNDTLDWDGGSWSSRLTPVAPSKRSKSAFAFDSSRKVAVLFGGHPPGIVYSDETWELNGSTWTQHFPVVHPGRLLRAAMAYDPLRHRTVLFGGFDNSLVERNGTWEWDGTSWELKQPEVSPPASGASSGVLVYDPTRQRLALFVPGTSDLATWEWDGTVWIPRLHATPDGGPGRRIGAAITYDSARDAFVVFGGQSNGVTLSTTWVLE